MEYQLDSTHKKSTTYYNKFVNRICRLKTAQPNEFKMTLLKNRSIALKHGNKEDIRKFFFKFKQSPQII